MWLITSHKINYELSIRGLIIKSKRKANNKKEKSKQTTSAISVIPRILESLAKLSNGLGNTNQELEEKQCTVQEISLLIFYAVANESQCNSDQTGYLEKNSDQHHQNFHSPRVTNPSNDCTASYVLPNLDHDNDKKRFLKIHINVRSCFIQKW